MVDSDMTKTFLSKTKMLPFSLTLFILALDQLTKSLVVRAVEPGQMIPILGDFLWLWHVRNKGMAFSLGNSFPDSIRTVLFIALPVVILVILVIYYFRNREINVLQRWCFASILGGGLGNLIDRILRPDGVVDYISFKFFGLLGMQRYPAFNVADSAVVVAGILLIISFLQGDEKKGEKSE